MAERRISDLKSSNTRTSDGKKVDEWSLSLPDGRSKITVMIHSNSDSIHFSAKGVHPCLSGLSWEGTDMQQLRQNVMEDVEKAAERYFKTDWLPSVMIEASLHQTDRKDERGIHLSFNMTQVHKDSERPIGNQGETTILKNHIPVTAIQRSHDQLFEYDKGDLSAKNMMYAREASGKPVARVIVDGDHQNDVDALASTLESFSIKLMRRMAPDMVRVEGLPTPDELRFIMSDAVDNPECEQPNDEEFIM